MRLIIFFIAIANFLTLPLDAQHGQLQGKIHYQDQEPAALINILVVGTNFATQTDLNGQFGFTKLPVGQYTLIFKSITSITDSTSVSIYNNQTTTLNEFKLSKSNKELAEVQIDARRQTNYIEQLPSASLRLTMPLLETPQNISVATQQTLKDFGITGTGEMARLTSGISKKYGNDNDIAFVIRGTDATNNIFRNGVGSYWWNQQSDAFMIDRVEFVKGPAGFMIGNSEPGGLLNEVTKQPDGITTRELLLGGGSFNLIRTGFDFGGKLKTKSKWSYRAVAGLQHTQSFYDFYKAHRYFALAAARYTYCSDGFLQVEWNRMDGRFKADNSNNLSYDGANFLFPETFNFNDPYALHGIETDDNYLKISHQHKFRNGWHIKSQIADVRGLYQGDAMYVAGINQTFDTLYRQISFIDWKNGVRSAQSFIDGKFETGNSIIHHLLTGVDLGSTWVNSAWGEAGSDNWGLNNPLNIYNPVYNLDRSWTEDTAMFPATEIGTQWAAWYGQDHIKFFNKYVLTLAGRYSFTQSFASWDSMTVNDRKFTPRVGFTYLISSSSSAYFLYDQTFLPQTGRKADQTLPTPLTGSNIELGFKAEINKKLAINSSLFNTVKKNVLVQNPQTTFYEERGEITSQGFELGVIGNITKQLILNFNYTFTDAQITDDVDSSMIGFPNYGVAKNISNIMIRYKFTKGKIKGVSLGIGSQYSDQISVVWAGWTNPKDKYKALPAYALYDANVTYDYKKWSFQCNVFNLTNERVFSTGWWNSNDDPNQAYFSGNMIAPRNFRVALNYRF